VHGSCESISTFKSNNSLTQESLEDDLFQDVRASIQNFGRMSDLARANRNVPSRFKVVAVSLCLHLELGIVSWYWLASLQSVFFCLYVQQSKF